MGQAADPWGPSPLRRAKRALPAVDGTGSRRRRCPLSFLL